MVYRELSLYGHHRAELMINSVPLLFHVNVEDESTDHEVWLDMASRKASVVLLKPAYDADDCTLDNYTAVFISVVFQHEIEDEFDQLMSRRTAKSKA